MPETYRVNEIFYSLQGEGKRAGEPSIFVRFSGCNLRCALASHGFDCDTEFVSGRTLSRQALVEEIQAASRSCRWIVLTGGEPSLQVDPALVGALHSADYQVAMETNGTHAVDGLGLDWITVSPKTAEHTLQQLRATEVKYVRHAGQGLPKPRIQATYYLLSPAFSAEGVSKEALQSCIALCQAHPQWSLSLQLHKLWEVR